MARSWTDHDLTEAVEQSKTIRQVCVTLGLKATSGNYRTVHKYIDKLGLDKSHFTGKRIDGLTWNKIPLKQIMVNGSDYSTYKLKLRLLQEGVLDNMCGVCGQPAIWQGKPLAIQLHHINGNHRDHRKDNLQMICPNCHAQTSNFSGKNK